MVEGKRRQTAEVTRDGKFEREKDETRYAVRKKPDNVSCGYDILFFILFHRSTLSNLSVSTLLLTPSSPFSSPRIPSPPRAASDSRLLGPIWKEFAQTLKCMFCAASSHVFFCLAVSSNHPQISSRVSVRTEPKLGIFKGTDQILWKTQPPGVNVDKEKRMQCCFGWTSHRTVIPLFWIGAKNETWKCFFCLF